MIGENQTKVGVYEEGYAMRERLFTIAQLKRLALGDLGLMTNASYDVFMRRAIGMASEKGVANPRLILDLVYVHPSLSVNGAKELPYLVSRGEWDAFIVDARVLLEVTPRVYVVDGDKFTASM